MTSLVRNIEYYKLQKGSYPDSMQSLRDNFKEGELVFSFTPSGPMTVGNKPRDFYYEIINNGKNYYLFSVGADGIPFTTDDLFPIIDSAKDKNIGWLKSN